MVYHTFCCILGGRSYNASRISVTTLQTKTSACCDDLRRVYDPGPPGVGFFPDVRTFMAPVQLTTSRGSRPLARLIYEIDSCQIGV